MRDYETRTIAAMKKRGEGEKEGGKEEGKEGEEEQDDVAISVKWHNSR